MKLKKLSALLLSALLLLSVLCACGTTVVVVEGGRPSEPATPAPTAEPTASPEPASAPADGGAVKTGLAILSDMTSSKDASVDGDGTAEHDILITAVTVDDAGVIHSCVIDVIQAKINFSAAGALTTDPAATFPTKLELGDGYGMRVASGIGKEWNEQAQSLADYCVGKTVAELKGVALDEGGHAVDDVDLTASVTVHINDLLAGVEAAVSNASHMGASKGDRLGLAALTNMESSKDASADGDGLAQAYATVAAVTFDGSTVTSCYIDAVQSNVNFDTAGKITSDLSAVPQTKNQLGDAYGMIVASSIGREWYEQAAAFCDYVTGKTVAEVTGLAVDEGGHATDVDLAASVTVHINEFQELIEKASR